MGSETEPECWREGGEGSRGVLKKMKIHLISTFGNVV